MTSFTCKGSADRSLQFLYVAKVSLQSLPLCYYTNPYLWKERGGRLVLLIHTSHTKVKVNYC